MINIISKSIVEGGINGPQKVVNNLIKGLDALGYPYCVNKALNSTSQLWIHDDIEALKEASINNLNALIGPNLYILPRNIPKDLNMSPFVYIYPTKWSADFWVHFGFNRCKIDYWPAGIDTEEFSEREKPKNGTVLIYFKQRYKEELDYVKKILDDNNIKYQIISYGSYEQKDYLKKLKDTKYIIWLGRQESQGIALEEALSMNVPILVWDVLKMGHWVPTNKEKNIFNQEELEYKDATAAYYFDETCGIKIKEKDLINDSILNMEKNWIFFEPRKYITQNLNLKKQAKDMIELFNKYYNISYESGKNECIKNNDKWINDKAYYKVFMYTKALIKKIIKIFKSKHVQ